MEGFGIAGKDGVVDDVVCKFYSGRPLYILRANDNPDVHRFIGEAYFVYGLLDGDTFELLDGSVATEEVLTIK